MRRAILVALVMWLPEIAAAAGGVDGNQMLKWCSEALTNRAPDGLAIGYCLGYLGGYRDGIAMEQYSIEQHLPPNTRTCIPDNVTPEQLARILVKELSDHPGSLHNQSTALVYAALNHVFPCK